MSWADVATWLGLALAVWQIAQVGRVASATHAAVTELARRAGNYGILLIIPQLMQAEKSLEDACTKGDLDAVTGTMRNWRNLIAEIRGYLDADPQAPEEIRVILQTSGAAVTRSKRLVHEKGDDLISDTRAIRTSMARVCEEMNRYAARIRVEVDPPPPPRALLDIAASAVTYIYRSRERDGQ